MAGKEALRFFSLLALVAADMHNPCPGATCPGCPKFIEGGEPVILFRDGVSVIDGDHNQLHKMEKAEFYIDDIDEYMDGAYVSLKANVTGTNITQHYDDDEGKLVLMGVDYASKYDQVIATIAFASTAPTPSSESRLIAFSIFDGDFWSPEYVTRVRVVFVNNHPPSIDVVANNETYMEHGGPINVFSSVTISDDDHPDQFLMEEAMIWVVGTFPGLCFGEQLIHVDLGSYSDNVTLVSDNPAGMIHLKGNASIDVYQHIIQTATFNSTGPEPPRGSVTIKVKINDGKFTGEANATLRIETFNDSPPRIEGIPLSEPVFIPDKGPVLVTALVDLEDCDDNSVHMWTKVEANISIRTSDFVDEFLKVNTGSFVDSIDRSNKSFQQRVILIPSDGRPYAPIEDFEGALRTLTYDNRNENISCPVRRVIKLKAWDGKFMKEKDVPVVIEPNNQFRPVLSITRTGHSFKEDGPAISLLSRARVSDRDMICNTLVMQGAQVNVTAPDGARDRILFDLTDTGVTVASNTTNANGMATIELTGNVDAHVYANVLQSIRYRNKKDEPTLGQRHIWISVFDGKFYSDPLEITVKLDTRNDQPPVLNSPHAVYNFTENGPPVRFDSIDLTDADSDEDDRKANLVEVWIEDQLNAPDEHLYVNTTVLPAGITVTRISPSRLKIDGPNDGDLLSKFNQVLQTLSYMNNNPEPAPGRRKILFRITSNAISPDNDVTETIYVDVFGVNDSPTLLDVSAPVNYTERSPPIRLAPDAMWVDDDLQPIDVPIDHLEITVLGNETGAIINCPGCQACNNVSVVNVSSQTIDAVPTNCAWSAAEVAAFSRNVTFAIHRREPPKIADEVRVMFKITDRDGLVGISYATVTVIHICDPGRLYLNATDMSTTAVAVFDEFSPETYVNLVEGPVMIRNNDSEIITEIQVIITKNFHDNDELIVQGGGGVTVTPIPMGLRITGMFTITEAKDIITSIQFRNLYECRIVNPRTVTIRLLDDCGAWTNVGTVTIKIRRNNDPPIVFPQSGSRQPIRHTYVVEGVANTNPSPLHVFPYFEVDDCDGPTQGHLAQINVTIMDAPDSPHERIYFSETVLNMTGLHYKVVDVDEHVVRYVIYHPNGTTPIAYFERLIRSLYYINEAECPFEVMRKIIVTVSDGEDTGEGLAIIYYQRNPVGPALKWNESDHETWSAAFKLLDRPDFDLIPGDVHFMHKAEITITNPIESATNPGNFFDHVFIDEADEDSVTALGIQILQDRKGPQLLLQYNGPVSNVDAAEFESILRKVKFDSLDPHKNCDRRITVTVWDSPLKRMSNVITVQVVVGSGTEDSECHITPTTESPTTPEMTTEPATTPETTSASPTTPETTSASPTTSETTSASPTTPETTSAPPTTPETTSAFPTSPETTSASPTTSETTSAPPTTPETTSASQTTPETASASPTTPEATSVSPTTPETTSESPMIPETTSASPTTPEMMTTIPPTTPVPLKECVSAVRLTTQAEVDDLAEEKCTNVTADLVISCDRSKENCFSNFELTGLSNIQFIYGALSIIDNRFFTLAGLENVKTFKSLEISDNTELRTTNHLRLFTHAEYPLENIESVRVTNQQRLDDVDGLKGITTVTGDVEINTLQDLDIAGLGHLKSVGGSFILQGVTVTSLSPLSSLMNVGGSLKIFGVESLSSLTGLDAVTSVGSIDIRDNDDLTNFDGGLGFLADVTGKSTFSGFSVVVYGNSLLNSTSQFPLSLAAVKGKVMIGANPALCWPSQILNSEFWNGVVSDVGSGIVTIVGNCL